LVIAVAGVASATVSPVLTFDFPTPHEYVPGGSITFDVLLTGAQDLSAYYVELVLDVDVGTVGNGADAWFEIPSAPDSASNYVFFDDNDLFLPLAGTLGTSLVLSIGDDIWPTSVTTAEGVNDLIATVTVRTAASMTGPLYIAIDGETLEMDNSSSDPIPEFAELQTAVTAVGPTEFTEVPEPASAFLLAFGVASLARRKQLHRTRT